MAGARDTRRRSVAVGDPVPYLGDASERIYWLSWAAVEGIGPHRLKRLYQHFGSLESAWQADEQDLMAVEGIGPQLAMAIQTHRRGADPEAVLATLSKPGIPFLTPADERYPRLLWELPDPPPLLYTLGQPLNWEPAIAMVGTRSPTPYGQRWAEEIAIALAQAGFVVVSGMAAGIDGVVHRACLKAGGSTIGVLGTGVDRVYPPQHRDLFSQMRSQGCLLSEFAPGTGPAKENFPRRNRLIAGLTQATIVMEAPQRSGALITAYLANDYGRDVYALPGSLDNPAARGCLNLIRTGAGIILGVEELLAELGSVAESGQVSAPEVPSAPAPPLAGSQKRIFEHLSTDPMSLDALAQATDLDINTITSELLMMELEGWVIQLPGMRYQRSFSCQ